MPVNKRSIVILFFVVMSFVPFLLITDLFPFMRFGMFAETIKHQAQQELFTVEIKTANGNLLPLSSRQQALDDSHLNYLIRTYYYKNELPFFCNELKKTALVRQEEKLKISKKTLQDKHWKTQVLIVE